MVEGKMGNLLKLPIDSIAEKVDAEPQVNCFEEEVIEILHDLAVAVDTKNYVPQTPTKDNPALSDDYIFDTNDENLVLKDLTKENFVGKVKDLSKGAANRRSKGLPQEYLYVFKYPCKLFRRDAEESGNISENVLIYIKVNDRKIPYKKVFIVSFHKNRKKRVAGENMENLEFAYCNECEDLVEYDIFNEMVTEQYKGEDVRFRFNMGRCKCCGQEVATDIDYNSRKSEARICAYKKIKGLIGLNEISEILEKYNVGKEALASIAGFGKATIKRYYEGFIPAREYSDVLVKLLNDESYFMECVRNNEEKLKEVTYNKILVRYERLVEISNSKIDQIANYIITHLGEVTPLALEKLLSFSNGVNYALNGKQLIYDESQAWQHGPVYPYIYNKYKKYGYRPIDDGINSSHGCMLSLLSEEEIKAIDMVIHTFGLYSPKTLEMISHTQAPWIEKRVGYRDDEAGHEVLSEASIKDYYIENELNSEEKIIEYILRCMK